MKFICAPMATISHPASRIMIEKFGGCDEYYNEMINAPSLLHGGPFEKYYIDPTPVPEKMVWQLTGKDVSSMVEAALVLCKLPGLAVDLNMGCCAPEIVRSGAGIAWMLKDIEETKSLVKGVAGVVNDWNASCGCEASSGSPKILSVKMRLGADDFTDSSFFSFCDMLVSSGVRRLTLHPRTQREKYRDRPRYEYVEELCKRYKGEGVEIILNGDVKDKESLFKALAKAPSCDGVMVGRAAVTKPWVFWELKKSWCEKMGLPLEDVRGDGTDFCEGGTASCEGGMSAAQDDVSCEEHASSLNALSLALSYIDDVMRYQPEEFWKTRLQRFFTYYSENFSFAHYFKSSLLNASSPDDAKARLEEYFKKVPGDLKLKISL